MKFTDFRRLSLLDIADEIFELICENSREVPDYDGYIMIEESAQNRIHKLTDELSRRHRCE